MFRIVTIGPKTPGGFALMIFMSFLTFLTFQGGGRAEEEKRERKKRKERKKKGEEKGGGKKGSEKRRKKRRREGKKKRNLPFYFWSQKEALGILGFWERGGDEGGIFGIEGGSGR